MNIMYCSSFLKKNCDIRCIYDVEKMKFAMVFLEFVCVELKCDFLSQNYIRKLERFSEKRAFPKYQTFNEQDGCIIVGLR